MPLASVISDVSDNLPRGATGWITLAGIAAGLVLLFLILRRLVPNRLVRALVMAVPVLALLWWVGSPLFIDRRVDDAFPTMAAPPAGTEPAPASTEPAPTAGPAGTPAPAAPAGPQRLSTGTFKGVGHRASGGVSVYRGADGRHVLRLEEIDFQNGPDLHVYLVPEAGQEDDAGARTLGNLKGNQGNQNYEVPPDVDLARFRTVLIWCRQFSVPFANATLA